MKMTHIYGVVCNNLWILLGLAILELDWFEPLKTGESENKKEIKKNEWIWMKTQFSNQGFGFPSLFFSQVQRRLPASFSSSLLSFTSALFPKKMNPWTLFLRYWWVLDTFPPSVIQHAFFYWWDEGIILINGYQRHRCALLPSFSGGLFCGSGCLSHGNESELHTHRLDYRGGPSCRRPLDAALWCLWALEGNNRSM